MKHHTWTVLRIFAVALYILNCHVAATRHTFKTGEDLRHLIAPIGAPFGFLTGGVYNLTIFDFELTIGKASKKKERTIDGKEALKYVEAGFFLKRFDSESDFSKFYETVLEKPSFCAFESHRDNNFAHPTTAEDDDVLEEDDKFQVKFDENEKDNLQSEDVGENGIYISMNNPEKTWKPNTPTITHRFTKGSDEGLYFLLFQLCPRGGDKIIEVEIRSSFELDLHFKNYDSYGNPSYLTAGEMKLPAMYTYFSISYALCFILWSLNIRNIRLGRDPVWSSRDGGHTSSRPVVHAIHHLMTVLLGLKALTVFFEAARYHFIKMNGHAEFLSAVYFTMSFIKGTFMFTVILLIGSGWSLVKPFLNEREKRIIWAVLVLQIIDNIAVIVLSQETEGERLYEDWSAVLHFVDILCCCAVLVPIVWQINSFETTIEAEAERAEKSDQQKTSSSAISDVESEAPATAEAAQTVQKLKQFRSFYLLVVVYIYFTRIAVYLFATCLGYRQTWLRYFVTELGTLVFYAVVGFLFRPVSDNPYLKVGRDAGAVEIEFA
jgi:NADH:ubiquinone oxidoreductase subunit 3 (subunit A)